MPLYMIRERLFPVLLHHAFANHVVMARTGKLVIAYCFPILLESEWT